MKLCLSSYLRLFANSEVTRHLTVLSIGSIVSQMIPILMSVVLSRIYTPGNYGDFSVFISTATILSVLVSARYEYAIVRAKHDDEAAAIVKLSGLIALLITLSLLIVVIVIYFKGTRIQFSGILWLPIYTAGIAMFQILSNYANYAEHYKLITIGLISRSVTQAVSRLILGLLKYEIGLIVGCVIGLFFACAVYIRGCKDRFRYWVRVPFQQVKKAGKAYINFPKYFLPSGLLNTCSTNIPILLLSYFYSMEDVGVFSMSISILYLPITMIGNALGQIFYKKASVWNNEQVNMLALRFVLLSAVIGFTVFVVIWFGGESLFALLLGNRWGRCGSYSLFLSPWLLAVLCISPLSWIFDVLDRQKTELLINIAMCISRVLVIVVSGFAGLSFGTTVLLYSAFGLILWLLEGKIICNLLRLNLRFKQKSFIMLYVVVVISGVICRLI